MDFYNKNNNLGLAKNVDISLNSSFNANIFTISDDFSIVYNSFILPNIKRNLGSYIIFDKNDSIYDLFADKNDDLDYKINKISLIDTFNIFSVLNSEDEIQILVKAILRNSTEIQRYLYEGKTEIDLLYNYSDLIFSLIMIYMLERIPFEKRCFKYVCKILEKLESSDLNYFKKIFGNVNPSYQVQSSIFHLDYMTEDEYHKSLSILTDVLSNTLDSKTKETTIINTIKHAYTSDKPELYFIELTDITVIDSFFCSYVEEYCYKDHTSKQLYPVIYIYAPFENIGHIPNLYKLLDDNKKNNDIHILSINSLGAAVKQYGKDIRHIMRNIPYGLMFTTKKTKNIELIQKLLSIDTISELMIQIENSTPSCILYKKKTNPTVELTLDTK